MEVAQKKTRAPKTTNKQLDFLITYMENHTAFATGKLLGARGKPAHDLQWQQLTDQLNSLDGPSKGTEGWKKISFFLFQLFLCFISIYFIFCLLFQRQIETLKVLFTNM